MAAVETSLAYASLILADSEIEISAENLATLTEKANVPVDKIYTTLFAKALEGKDLKEFFFNFSAAPAAGAAGAAAGSSAAAEEAAEEEEEAAEESDDDMGLDLFG